MTIVLDISDQVVRERAARALARAAPPPNEIPFDDLPGYELAPYYEGADAVLMELGIEGNDRGIANGDIPAAEDASSIEADPMAAQRRGL